MSPSSSGQVWLSIPFASLILLARLQGVPPWLYQAAKMDGAGRGPRLRHVTLPLLRNTLLIVVLVELILAFQTFDLVYALTSGGPAFSTLVLSMLIYHRSFADLRIGYGSALAMMLTAVVAIASIAVVLINRGRGRDARMTRADRSPMVRLLMASPARRWSWSGPSRH